MMMVMEMVVMVVVSALVVSIVQPGCANEWVDYHNQERALVGVPPLQWDEQLASFARSYAEGYELNRGSCRSLISSGGPYGENLFWGGAGYPWSSSDAFQSWAVEKEYYYYDSNSCQMARDCGHYTQIVWRTSTRVGCATLRCSDQSTFIICNYDPPGNYIGQRPY